MKQSIVLFCALLLSSLSFSQTWQPVGPNDFEQATLAEAGYLTVTLDAAGTPYIAFADGTKSDKVTVKKYFNNAWSVVGTEGFSSGVASYVNLAFDPSGNLYVAYSDAAGSLGGKAIVKKFNGTSWANVGGTTLSAGQANYISLKFNSVGTPYVAYQDMTNLYHGVNVKMFNGTSWVAVGNTTVTTTNEAGIDVQLAFGAGNIPYVAFRQDLSTSGNHLKGAVRKLDVPSNTWVTVGAAYITPGQAYSMSFAMDAAGVPYLAYADAANGVVASVQKFNGSAWVMVGAAGFSPSTISSPCIRFDASGNPFLAFYDGSLGKAAVMKFISGAWTALGGQGSIEGYAWPNMAIDATGNIYVANYDAARGYLSKFSGSSWSLLGTKPFADNAKGISVSTDNTGMPYCVYADGTLNNKATVKKFNGTDWVTVGLPGFSSGDASGITMTLSPSGTPYVAYADATLSYKSTVMMFDGTTWTAVGTPGFSAGTTSSNVLAFDNAGVLYIGYVDNGNGTKATVKKFNGSAWVTVGVQGFSAGTVNWMDLAISPAGEPYVTYRDNGNGSKTTVKKFDGTSWVNVGTAGFSTGLAWLNKIAFDATGVPYVLYGDANLSTRAVVKKFDGSSWINVGPATGISTGVAEVLNLSLNPNGTPYISYRDVPNGNKPAVKKYNGTSWVDVGPLAIAGNLYVNDVDIACYSNKVYVIYGTGEVSGGLPYYWGSFSKLFTETVSPSVTISTPVNAICSQTQVVFTATASNAGTTPGYQWRKNTANIAGATNNTYTTNTLVNNDAIDCIVTSSDAGNATATSNSISMTVNSTVVPAVSISATATDICAGAGVSFAAFATNGGANPAYQWKQNGTNIPGATNASYNTAALADQDVIGCVLTSNAACAAPLTAADSVTITVHNIAAAAVTISSNADTVCAGSAVLFTAVPVNGGAAPQYQWQLNGINIAGVSGATYSSATLSNGDTISCILTSNQNCASPSVASSNLKIMTVNPVVVPAVSISATATVIVAGTSVSFTATPVNGGTSPVYAWKKNGIATGTNNPVYTDNSLADGDVISCMLTSNAPCAVPAAVSSDSIVMVVQNTCSVWISASGPTTFCPGGSVVLTASAGDTYLWNNGATTPSIAVSDSGSYSVSISNGNGCTASSAPLTVTVKSIPNIKIKNLSSLTVCSGSSVTLTIDPLLNTSGFNYQWSKDSSSIIAATASTYEAAAAGAYTITVSDGQGCSKTSLAKTVLVNPLPVASISADGATSFCDGASVALSADVQPGYTYKWLRDGLSSGTASSIIAKKNGNYLVIAKLNGCSDTSSSIPVTVYTLPAANVSSYDSTTFCSGGNALLFATPSGPGYYFAWKLGVDTIPGNSTPLCAATLKGSYKVIITDSNGCWKSSAGFKINVGPTPVATITPLGATTIASNGSVKLRAASGTGYTWQWYRNGGSISGATARDYIATQFGDYSVLITKGNCSAVSDPVTVTQSGVKETQGLSSTAGDEFELAAFPNPVSTELTLSIKGLETVKGTVQLMDMDGRLVLTKEVNTAVLRLDMQALPSGTYLLRYRDSARTGTLRIVKE